MITGYSRDIERSRTTFPVARRQKARAKRVSTYSTTDTKGMVFCTAPTTMAITSPKSGYSTSLATKLVFQSPHSCATSRKSTVYLVNINARSCASTTHVLHDMVLYMHAALTPFRTDDKVTLTCFVAMRTVGPTVLKKRNRYFYTSTSSKPSIVADSSSHTV